MEVGGWFGDRRFLEETNKHTTNIQEDDGCSKTMEHEGPVQDPKTVLCISCVGLFPSSFIFV